ncbi:MAG TPA: GNAT family N-acetyltransferase [Nocardioides sp.]
MAAPLTLRAAAEADVPALTVLWSESLRADDEAAADVARLVAESQADDQHRIVVAEYGGAFAGAVLLRLVTVSPLDLTPMVHLAAPTVLPEFRRRGVGRALVEAGVAFAEEHDVPQVSTASLSTSRDANRFMARLGLATRASFRIAPTATVRARITAMRPTMARPPRQQLTSVLAARRSMRRQTTTQRAC